MSGQTTNDFKELKQALEQFRELFVRKLLSPTVVNGTAPFLKTMRFKKDWPVSDALRVYNILKPYSLHLQKVGFDFKTVPEIKIGEIPRQAYYDRNSRLVGCNQDGFIVKTPYSKEIVNALMEIDGAKWLTAHGYWAVPLSRNKEVEAFAKRFGFLVTEKGRAMFANIETNLDASYKADEVELNLPLKLPLYPFQSSGVDYCMKNKRAIVGDEMGLGKTVQGIGTVLGTDTFPCLVICPKSLRYNWQDEWAKFTDKKTMILTHKNMPQLKNYIELGLLDVAIINYEGARTLFTKEIQEIKITKGARAGKTNKKVHTWGYEKHFNSVILDEAHECRNRSTLRFKTIRPLFQDKEVRLCLTGTPIVKGPADMAALLDLVGQIEHFGGHFKFIKQYYRAKKNFFDNKQLPTNLQDLNVKLRSLCFIRREKIQVLKELPDKLRQIIKVDLDNRREYDEAMFNLQDYLLKKNVDPEKIDNAMRAEMLVLMGILKKLSARGKLSAFKEFVNEVREAGQKLIVFVWHKESARFLKEHFPGTVTVTGDDTEDEIDNNKKAFQNDPATKMIVLTYKKGGVGHTLTAASKVAFLELGWTWKDQGQAEDRAHRIGQKFMVNCYYFLGRNTIDERTYEIIEQRRLIEKEATGGKTDYEVKTFNQLTKDILNSINNNGTKKLLSSNES